MPWPAIAVQAIVFAAAHGLDMSLASLDLLVFSIPAGVLAVRTGGLEAAIALHIMNNVLALTWSAAVGTLADENVPDVPWQLLAVAVLAVTGYMVVTLRLAHRRNITVRKLIPPTPNRSR
jgi:uncharacterized protein